LVEPSRLCR